MSTNKRVMCPGSGKLEIEPGSFRPSPSKELRGSAKCSHCKRKLRLLNEDSLPHHVAKPKAQQRAQTVTMKSNRDGTITIRSTGGFDLRKILK